MTVSQSSLLRLYLNASDRRQGKPLYQAAVEVARARHLAGASVFRVDLGFGVHQLLHNAASEYLSSEIPLVVEVVDGPDRVEGLLAELGSMVTEGLATVGPVRVIRPTRSADREESGISGRPEDRPGASTSFRDPMLQPRSTTPMMIEGEAQRVTVYIGSSDTWRGRNLAAAIVERCRAMGLAGATATRGVMGFGENSRIHRAHFLGLSEDLPERIEVVDRPERIAQLLPVLDEMVGGGLILMEDVRVIRYRHDPKAIES